MALNILMLGWELPPFNSGGLGEACLGLSKSLAKKGVLITFVLPKKVNIQLPFLKIIFANVDEEISFLPPAYLTSLPRYLLKSSEDDFPPDYIQVSLKLAKKMDKILKGVEEVDIIHSHDWMTFPAGIEAKRILDKPLIVHVHSTEFDRTGNLAPNPFVYEIEREGFKNADEVVCVSGRVKEILINRYGVNENKVKIVYNGIDPFIGNCMAPVLKEFKEMGYKIVLFLGRITLQKGPEYFVRASKRILEYNPKVIFVVTGSGDMYDHMISEAIRLGVLNNFIFTGFLRDEEKNRVYQSADIYVMPSVSEPFGITALEAVANGIPSLISKQSGVSEVLTNVLKVDFWDIDEMANKILGALTYDSLCSTLKKESSKEIKSLSWDKSADRMLEIYNQLV